MKGRLREGDRKRERKADKGSSCRNRMRRRLTEEAYERGGGVERRDPCEGSCERSPISEGLREKDCEREGKRCSREGGWQEEEALGT